METKTIEIRQNKLDCRAIESEDGKKGIEGYAILWGQESKLIYERGVFFYEKIERGAADKVLLSKDLNVKHNYNHGQMIARTKSGSLRLESDERGLKYIIEDMPNTTDANNLYELVKRQEVYESSFAFMVDDEGQNWTKRADGANLRTVSEFSYLGDVSSVDDGFYSNTEVAVRSLKEHLKPDLLDLDEDYLIDLDSREKELQILKLKK